MFCHGSPAVAINAAVAEHLEILLRSACWSLGVVKGVLHADALDRALRNTVNHQRLRKPDNVQYSRRDVDDVVPLRAYLTFGLDAIRPVKDDAIARAAIVRRDLLRPLERTITRMRK